MVRSGIFRKLHTIFRKTIIYTAQFFFQTKTRNTICKTKCNKYQFRLNITILFYIIAAIHIIWYYTFILPFIHLYKLILLCSIINTFIIYVHCAFNII